MKLLNNFVCVIILVLGVGMALGKIGPIYLEGMDHIPVIAPIVVSLLMVSTLVCAFLSKELSKSFVKAACFAPLGNFLIVLVVGIIESGLFLNVGMSKEDSAISETVGEHFLLGLPVIASVFVMLIAAAPLLVIAGDIQRARNKKQFKNLTQSTSLSGQNK